MDRIKIRLDVDGNLGPIDQMAAKFKVADKNVEDLIGSIDKLNSKSITLQVKDQIASHRANDPLFKKIDFMPDKSIKPLPAFDMLANIKNQVDENRKSTQAATTDLISGALGAIAGGGGVASIASLLGGIAGGPIGAAVGLVIGKVVGALGDILVGAMKTSAGLLLDFAKSVVDAAAYREDNIITLSKLSGSDDAGRREFDYVTRIADKTSFSTKQISDLTTRLFTLGFKANEVDSFRGRALDIATLKGNNPLVLEQYADALNKIKGQGKYNGHVENLDLIEKQIPGGKEGVRLQIAKELGLKGNDKSLLEQVAKLIEKGKISSITGINAINHLIEKTLPGAPGSYAKEAATKSLSGAISNVQDAFSNNLLRINWSESPGIVAFRKFLVNLSETLGSKEFQGMLEKLANTLFKGFENIHKEDITKWFEKLEGALLMLIPAIEKTWAAIQKIITGEDSIVGGLVIGFADVAVQIGKLLVAGVLDALPGGSHDHLAKAVEAYRNEQAAKAAEKAEEKGAMDAFHEYKAKVLAERARKYADEPFAAASKAAREKEAGVHIYKIKVDARGRGKKVMDEINAAAQKARLAAGR